MASTPLTSLNATVNTAIAEIRTLNISGKQVTLATFRQVPEREIYSEDGNLLGTPWGRINYCPGKSCHVSSSHRHGDDHDHVLWKDEESGVLYQCRIWPRGFQRWPGPDYSDLAEGLSLLREDQYGLPGFDYETWEGVSWAASQLALIRGWSKFPLASAFAKPTEWRYTEQESIEIDSPFLVVVSGTPTIEWRPVKARLGEHGARLHGTYINDDEDPLPIEKIVQMIAGEEDDAEGVIRYVRTAKKLRWKPYMTEDEILGIFQVYFDGWAHAKRRYEENAKLIAGLTQLYIAT